MSQGLQIRVRVTPGPGTAGEEMGPHMSVPPGGLCASFATLVSCGQHPNTRSPTFLAPGTGSMEDNLPRGRGLVSG